MTGSPDPPSWAQSGINTLGQEGMSMLPEINFESPEDVDIDVTIEFEYDSLLDTYRGQSPPSLSIQIHLIE